jgi:hypothetical protein
MKLEALELIETAMLSALPPDLPHLPSPNGKKKPRRRSAGEVQGEAG